MNIKATDVKQLREKTNAGFMACKKALQEANGDQEKAIELLRKQGLSVAEKKKGRKTSEGVTASYIHLGSKIGVLVEVNCETDFAAKSPVFKDFVKDITMHVAARNPKYLLREDVPPQVIDKEKEIIGAQITDKPAHVIDKIVEGKIGKFYEENCLLDQGFIKEPDLSIQEYLKQKIAEIGENIVIRRFTRYCVGEEI